MLSAEKKFYHSQLLLLTIGVFVIIAIVIMAKSVFPDLSCPIRSALGLKCPGCGGTSAVNHLLAGNVHSAISSNAVVSISLMGLAIYNFYFLIARISNKRVKVVPLSLKVGITFLLVIVIFTIFRN